MNSFLRKNIALAVLFLVLFSLPVYSAADSLLGQSFGDGSTVLFTLPASVPAGSALSIEVGGQKVPFTWTSATTVTLTTAPVSKEIINFRAVSQTLGQPGVKTPSVTANGYNGDVTITPNGTGAVVLTGGADATKTVKINSNSATAGADLTLSNVAAADITVTLPIQAGALPTAYFCGATSGTTTCPNTSTAGTGRVIGGIATLASNSAVISAISPAFTGTTTFACVANDLTTRANPVQVANTSTSSITITNTTGASDVINWVCVGY